MNSVLMAVLVGAIPTLISIVAATVIYIHKVSIDKEILLFKLAIHEKLEGYVKTGSLDKEISDLKFMIANLSKQVGDLQRDFDRNINTSADKETF